MVELFASSFRNSQNLLEGSASLLTRKAVAYEYPRVTGLLSDTSRVNSGNTPAYPFTSFVLTFLFHIYYSSSRYPFIRLFARSRKALYDFIYCRSYNRFCSRVLTLLQGVILLSAARRRLSLVVLPALLAQPAYFKATASVTALTQTKKRAGTEIIINHLCRLYRKYGLHPQYDRDQSECTRSEV